jgi:hypothetical protein
VRRRAPFRSYFLAFRNGHTKLEPVTSAMSMFVTQVQFVRNISCLYFLSTAFDHYCGHIIIRSSIANECSNLTVHRLEDLFC